MARACPLVFTLARTRRDRVPVVNRMAGWTHTSDRVARLPGTPPTEESHHAPRRLALALLPVTAPPAAGADTLGVTPREAFNRFIDRQLASSTHDELRQLTVPQLEGRLDGLEREALGTRHVEFTVDVPVIVSVVRDTEKLLLDPSWFWLEDLGFARTESHVEVIDRPQEVWEATFDAGRVGLGVNGLEDADLHYFVVVRPLDPAAEVEVTVETGGLDQSVVGVGNSPYVDRTHPLTAVPEELRGAAMVRSDVDPTKSAFRMDQLFRFLPTAPRSCTETPEPQRWLDAGTPDAGAADALVSAHRGAPALAPENTLASYEYAFAYGVDLVEVDVQQTADGRFVALHDSTVDRTTDGTGAVDQLTFAQLRALNAADYAPWAGGPYDPSQMASIEEVMTLARQVGGRHRVRHQGVRHGRGPTRRPRRRARRPRHLDLQLQRPAHRGRAARGPAHLQHQRPRDTGAAVAPRPALRGVRLPPRRVHRRGDRRDPRRLRHRHAHAYDAGPDQEAAQFEAARAIGADGAQTNQPDVVVAALGEPVSTAFRRADGMRGRGGCLVNADNALGLPGKTVDVHTGGRTTSAVPGRGGCVPDGDTGSRGPSRLTWRGDGSTLSARGLLRP